MKNSLKGSTTDLRWQKKEPTDFKIEQKELSSLNTEGKENKRNSLRNCGTTSSNIKKKKRIQHHCQGWFDIWKSVTVLTMLVKEKNHMIILVDKEKAFNKIQHPFLIKYSEQSRNRRELP